MISFWLNMKNYQRSLLQNANKNKQDKNGFWFWWKYWSSHHSTKDFCSPLHSICSCIAIIMPIDNLQNKKMSCPATDCQLIKRRNFHMEGGQFSSISGRRVFPGHEMNLEYFTHQPCAFLVGYSSPVMMVCISNHSREKEIAKRQTEPKREKQSYK